MLWKSNLVLLHCRVIARLIVFLAWASPVNCPSKEKYRANDSPRNNPHDIRAGLTDVWRGGDSLLLNYFEWLESIIRGEGTREITMAKIVESAFVESRRATLGRWLLWIRWTGVLGLSIAHKAWKTINFSKLSLWPRW